LRMKRRFYFIQRAGLLCLLAILFSCFAFSQTKVISGRVTDSKDGAPLSGVSVQIKGQSIGVTTDTTGSFSINATQGATLVLTHTGYNAVQLKVGTQSVFNVQMELSSNSLGEVLVIGY